MGKIDPNIFTEARNASAIADGGCGTCQRGGMPFFLVRQSVINPKVYHSINWSESVPNLKGRQPSAALTQHKYALRMLRKGYVYVLMEQNGNRKLLGYEVTSKGALRHRSIAHMKKYEIEDLAESCTAINHYIPAIFANIDVLNATVWIAYSRRAWSRTTEDYYRSVEADLRRFTKVTINDSTRKKPELLSPDGRSFEFRNLLESNKAPHLPEFFFGKKDFQMRFPSAHEFNDYSHKDDIAEITKITNILEDQYQCKLGCIVLEDTFGVVEELNAQRLQNFDLINNAFLEHERVIEKKLADKYNEKIADYTPTDQWLNSAKEQEMLYPYAKNYLDGFINQDIGDNQSNISILQVSSEKSKGSQEQKSETNNHKYLNEYFSTERAYKRRILSCIESYKKGLNTYYRNTIEDDYKGVNTDEKYMDVYEPAANFKGAMASFKMRINALKSLGWKEVSLSAEEKQVLIEKHKSTTNAKDVRRFHWSLESAAENKFNKSWAKLEERLDLDRLKKFYDDDNQKFKEIIKDIRKISIDYLIYVTWLFGSKDKPSQYAPSELTDYNLVEFWKHEQENDYSKDHLGYFEDLITMLQGNITMAKLPEQFGLWDSLFRDENSIYFYLLKGQNNNLYDMLLKQRIVEMEKGQDIANKEKTINNLNNIVSNLNSVMNLPIEAKNTTLFVDMMERLFNWGIAGFANRPNNANLINQVLMENHSIEQLKIFSGVEYRRMTVEVKIKNLPKIYEFIMEKSNVSSVNIEQYNKVYKLSKIPDTDTRWRFENELTKKQLEKTVSMDFMIVAEDLASMEKMINTLKKGGKLKETTLAKTKTILGAEIKHSHQFGGELTLQDLETAYAHVKKRIRVDSSKAIGINTLMIFFQAHLFSQNLYTLNEQGKTLPQDVKDQISHDMLKSCVIMSLLSAEVISHTIRLAGALSKINIFTTMIPSCATFMKVTGAALAIITILDGVISMYKGIGYAINGDIFDGILVGTGGFLIFFSGILFFSGVILSLALPLALTAIVLAIIGAILVSLGSEADSWSPMQIWFNRCYFGKHDHPEKGQPYPLTTVGTSVALNDYYAYLSGMYLSLNYNYSDREFFLIEDFNRYDEFETAEHLKYLGGLRVHINLPNFSNKSRYTCVVYLIDKNGNIGKAKLKQGNDQQCLHVAIEQNQCERLEVRWVETKDYPITSSPIVINKGSDDNLSTLLINQKVAELRERARKVIGILHYWQDENAKSPLRIEYMID